MMWKKIKLLCLHSVVLLPSAEIRHSTSETTNQIQEKGLSTDCLFLAVNSVFLQMAVESQHRLEAEELIIFIDYLSYDDSFKKCVKKKKKHIFIIKYA